MKVTVNFGSVRVIVPCGAGDLQVKTLMDLAITRYKKATGKSVDSWVTIHNLKLLSDGGILDPDDKLNDVADDREQITAVFDEQLSSYLMHNGGDGTSASSVGTESPDLFQNGDLLSMPLGKSVFAGSDIELKEDKISAEICGLSSFLPLHVRRGSEPALNRLSPSLLPHNDSCKRWSAAVLASDDCFKRLNSEGEEQSEDEVPPGEREDGSGEEKSASYQQFLDSWNREICLSAEQRKEPLGGPIISPRHSTSEAEESDCSSSSFSKVQVMTLKNEDGPLGIEIVPADNSPDKHKCVKIQHIVPGGRIDRDGRFSVGDHITEINGLKLNKDSYQNANEILRDAMKAPELSIHCIKGDSFQRTNQKNKPATLPKPLVPFNKTEDNCDKTSDDCEKANTASITSVPFGTPTKNFLANVLLHKGTPGHSSIRKVGRRILVHLTKGSEGLGFSITSKDPNNGPPFFIKNILPAGAAVDDGRLKTGDKLLEVNKLDVSDLTQTEVLNILRKIPFGDVVELVISRQETDLSPSPSLPRQLPPEKGEEEVGIVPWKRRDVFTYEVPLNDTGSAGLGVSVKGKTSNTAKGPVDMGIFLKNIFHGGAAHKDGRLLNNDQLLNVNGISLLSMTNGQAMETLRRAMIQNEGPNNAIILTVARRVPSLSFDNPSDHGEGSGHDRSDSLLSESGDSFYVSNENLSLVQKCNGITPDTSTSDNSANTVIFRTPGNLTGEDLFDVEVPVTELIDIHTEVDSLRRSVSSQLNSVHSPKNSVHSPKNSVSSQQYSVHSQHSSVSSVPNGVHSQRNSVSSQQYSTHSKQNSVSSQRNSVSSQQYSVHSQKNSVSSQNSVHSQQNSVHSQQYSVHSQQNSIHSLENGASPQLHNGYTKAEVYQQRFVSDLIDLQEHNGDYEPLEQSKGNGSLRNHNKTFRDLTEVDLYNTSASEAEREPETRYCDTTQSSFRETTKRKRFPIDRNNHFKRNGLSRQSMPEKMFTWSPQRNQCLTNRGMNRATPQSPRLQCMNYSEEIHEMPVDVGPVEAMSSLRAQKLHRKVEGNGMAIEETRRTPAFYPKCCWSCNSPDCPYHAVPTTSHESGGSEETSTQVGPALGLYKSSSLESLQTMLHEKKKQNLHSPNGNTSRGCNESFRAAVDKSFEAVDQIESSTAEQTERQKNGTIRHHTRSKTENFDKKDAKPNKKKGLFRGLGSVFRFGKSSKKSKDTPSTTCKSVQPELVNLQTQDATQIEHERIHAQNDSRASFTFPRIKSPPLPPSPSQNRQDRMCALRNEHQKRHRERNGFYPQEDREEIYERRLKEVVDKAMVNRPLPPLPHQQTPKSSQRNQLEMSPKSKDFEIYKEMSKPGSRKGFVDPTRYSHYMNFQEIQQHLQQFHHHQALFLHDNPSQSPSYLPLSTPNRRHYRHTVSSARSRPASELFDLRKTDLLSGSFRAVTESGGSLPRKMFQNGRQRPPIPSQFMAENNGSSAMNGTIYAQRNCGSKV